MKVSKLRKGVVRSASLALLLLPFVFVSFLVGEAYVRLANQDQIPPVIPCQQYDPKLRHRYRPLCKAEARSAFGMIEYEFNEDGLRDRPRDFFVKSKGVVAVMGDSVTEGIFLPLEKTIPRQLESELETRTSLKFLNAGIRFTSPTLHYLHFRNVIAPNYPIRAVVWLLNASDTNDERLFLAEAVQRDEEGFPSGFAQFGSWNALSNWITIINKFNRGRSELIATLSRLLTFQVYRYRISPFPANKENLCSGMIRMIRDIQKRGLPLLIGFTAHYAKGLEHNWGGESYHEDDLRQMISCARETGAAVIDLTQENLQPEWFAADLIHYSPEGAAWTAKKLAPALLNLSQRLAPGNP